MRNSTALGSTRRKFSPIQRDKMKVTEKYDPIAHEQVRLEKSDDSET